MDNQLTAIGTLLLFETNRAQREAFVNDIVERIENGEADALKIHLLLKSMESIIETLTSTDEKKNKLAETAKKYRKLLLDSAALYGKTFELFNARFDTKEVGTKYDYIQCGDAKLLELYAQQEALKEEIKKREKFLQAAPERGAILTDEESGETTTVYPPSRTSTTSLSVTLK